MGLQTPFQRVTQQFAAQIVSVSIPLCMWSQGKTNDVPNLRQSSPSCNRRHRLTSISQKKLYRIAIGLGGIWLRSAWLTKNWRHRPHMTGLKSQGYEAIKGRCSSDVWNSHIGVVGVFFRFRNSHNGVVGVLGCSSDVRNSHIGVVGMALADKWALGAVQVTPAARSFAENAKNVFLTHQEGTI